MKSPFMTKQLCLVAVHQPLIVGGLPLMWARPRWRVWKQEAFTKGFFKNWIFLYPKQLFVILPVRSFCQGKHNRLMSGAIATNGEQKDNDNFLKVNLFGNYSVNYLRQVGSFNPEILFCRPAIFGIYSN